MVERGGKKTHPSPPAAGIKPKLPERKEKMGRKWEAPTKGALGDRKSVV